MSKLVNLALTQVGVKEWKGSNHNPEILKYFKDIGFSSKKITDETAWCSAALNWLCAELKLMRSHKLDARSWLEVGREVDKPRQGDIVVLWRENPDSWKGHVGIYIRQDRHFIYVLGGNQSNAFNIAKYPKKKLLAYRRIEKKDTSPPKTVEVIKEVEVIKKVKETKALTEYTAVELVSAFLAVIFRKKQKEEMKLLPTAAVKVGDEVFVPKYRAFGTVKEILENGRISKVEIATPRGTQIIDTLNLIVKIAMILDGLIPTIRRIWRNIFKKETLN